MKLNYRSWLCALLLFALVATQLPRTLAQTNEANPYAALKKGQVVHGFRTDAVYLDATDKPFGGHFIHVRTGFTLDLLQIRSVPQAVIYANTFTVSDMGEPYSATLTEYSDTSRDAILNFLASKLYTGGGAHSVFNKTVGADLAYSNGIGSNPQTGLMSYYAERTPELPQTLRFDDRRSEAPDE